MRSTVVASKKIIVAFMLGVFLSAYLLPSYVRAATDAELMDQIAELTRILQALKAQVATSNSSTASAPVLISDWFTEPVVFEAENNSIKFLQEVLKTDPAIYPEGMTSGYYGALTKNAVAAFQAKFKLPVSGSFTDDVEYVLNYALSAVPFKTYPNSFLVSDKGIAAITAGVNDLAIRDLVIGGVVVLSTTPVFSETTPSSDTATIQRILSTSGMYRGLKVNGLMDTITLQSVSEFLRTYGVPFTIPADGVLRADSLMSTQTISLFRRILEKNASATVVYDLLNKPEVQPTVLIPNKTRTISALKAIRDYRANNTIVKVSYDGGLSEEFVLTVVSPNRDVAAAVATKLDRPVAQINTVIKYDSVYGDDFKTIKLSVFTSNAMVLDIEYKNGKSERRDISDADIEGFIAYTYRGDRVAYQKDFDYYVEKARKGEPIEKVYQLVADTMRTTKDKVRDILVIDVEQYSNDPCAIVYCNPGGA